MRTCELLLNFSFFFVFLLLPSVLLVGHRDASYNRRKIHIVIVVVIICLGGVVVVGIVFVGGDTLVSIIICVGIIVGGVFFVLL